MLSIRATAAALVAVALLAASPAVGRSLAAAEGAPRAASGAQPAQAAPRSSAATTKHGARANKAQAPQERYYIFGYGSLLSKDSTARSNCQITGLSEDAISGMEKLLDLAGVNLTAALLSHCRVKGERAVRVKGLQRGWYAPVTNTGTTPANPFPGSAFNNGWTALGAIAKPDAYITGLVYEVDRPAFLNTIERERKGGYLVKQLANDDVTVLSGRPLPAGANITAFVSPPSGRGFALASAAAPIPLSYIDVWLGGSTELQRRLKLSGESYLKGSGGKYSSFVEETVLTTDAWRPFIVNDREKPLRPYENAYLAAIDDALYKYVDHQVLAAMRFPGFPFPSSS